MPIWLNALGVAGIGVVYGYTIFYSLKRYMPPVARRPPSIRELLLFLVAMGLSGAIGSSFVSLDGVNYVGPYGLGLLGGMVANIVLSVAFEVVQYRYPRPGEKVFEIPVVAESSPDKGGVS
jgi:hypothetical protein